MCWCCGLSSKMSYYDLSAQSEQKGKEAASKPIDVPVQRNGPHFPPPLTEKRVFPITPNQPSFTAHKSSVISSYKPTVGSAPINIPSSSVQSSSVVGPLNLGSKSPKPVPTSFLTPVTIPPKDFTIP